MNNKFYPLNVEGENMNCDKIVLLLSDYIDELLEPLEVDSVEKHLNNCDSCSEELRKFEQTVNLLRNLPKLSAPPYIIANVNSIIEQKEASLPIIDNIDFSAKKKKTFTSNIFRSLSIAAGLLLSFVLGISFWNYKYNLGDKTIAQSDYNDMESEAVMREKKARKNYKNIMQSSEEKSSENQENEKKKEQQKENAYKLEEIVTNAQSSEDASGDMYGAGAAQDYFDDAEKDFRQIEEYDEDNSIVNEEPIKRDKIDKKNRNIQDIKVTAKDKDNQDIKIATTEELERHMSLQKENRHREINGSRVDENASAESVNTKLPNSAAFNDDVKFSPSSVDIGHTMGSNNCSSCHKQQAESWSKIPHSRSLQYFASTKFQKILKKMNGNIFLCMECHGSLKDNKFSSISCESCHGVTKKWLENSSVQPKPFKQENLYHEKHVLVNLKSPEILLETCYKCHKINNETLINNGHPIVNLDVITGLQKKIKHYPEYNEKRIELLSLISKLMDLRYALKEFASAQNKGKYLNYSRRSISIACMMLMRENRNKNIAEINEVLNKFRSTKISSNNQSELLELVDFILLQEKALMKNK